MCPQDVRERFRLIVRKVFQKALRPRQFRRQRTNFYRQLTPIIQLVNFQSSAWNAPAYHRFTINLGVYRSGLIQVLHQRAEPRIPSIASVPIPLSMRIARLDPDLQSDMWWEICDADSPERDDELVSELIWRLEQHGIPFFECLTSDKEILEYFREYCERHQCGVLEMEQFAVLAYLAGDFDQCEWGLEQAVRRLLQRANDQEWVEHIPNWLKEVLSLADRIYPEANIERIINIQ